MSLKIDPQVEKDLATLADIQNVSVNVLLREFTAKQKRYWQERAEDKSRLAAMKENGGISQSEMKDHFQKLREAAQTRL